MANQGDDGGSSTFLNHVGMELMNGLEYVYKTASKEYQQVGVELSSGLNRLQKENRELCKRIGPLVDETKHSFTDMEMAEAAHTQHVGILRKQALRDDAYRHKLMVQVRRGEKDGLLKDYLEGLTSCFTNLEQSGQEFKEKIRKVQTQLNKLEVECKPLVDSITTELSVAGSKRQESCILGVTTITISVGTMIFVLRTQTTDTITAGLYALFNGIIQTDVGAVPCTVVNAGIFGAASGLILSSMFLKGVLAYGDHVSNINKLSTDVEGVTDDVVDLRAHLCKMISDKSVSDTTVVKAAAHVKHILGEVDKEQDINRNVLPLLQELFNHIWLLDVEVHVTVVHPTTAV